MRKTRYNRAIGIRIATYIGACQRHHIAQTTVQRQELVASRSSLLAEGRKLHLVQAIVINRKTLHRIYSLQTNRTIAISRRIRITNIRYKRIDMSRGPSQSGSIKGSAINGWSSIRKPHKSTPCWKAIQRNSRIIGTEQRRLCAKTHCRIVNN